MINVFDEASARLPYITKESGTNEDFEIVFEDDQSWYEYVIKGTLSSDGYYDVVITSIYNNPRSFFGPHTTDYKIRLAPKQLCTLFDRWYRAYHADSQNSPGININKVLRGWARESVDQSDNSIFEQMNKIDDKESLNEKYNVRTLKDVKKLQEAGPRLTVDSEGLQKNLPIVIKKIISELPFEITSHRLKGSISRETRPVRYTFTGNLYLTPGENAKSRFLSDDKKNEIDVWFRLYSLPTNCELTAELLEERYGERILEIILADVKSTDSVSANETLYRTMEKEFIDAIKSLESKYNVTLYPFLYPDIKEFSREGGHVTDYVRITSVSGKLGQLKKQEDGYYEYEINGISYSSYLRYNEHNVSPRKYVKPENFDVNWIVQETSKQIEDLLNSIDTLDNLIKNEPAAEKQMAEYISSLQSKYTDATITVKRGGWLQPKAFIVTYEKDGKDWKLDISLDDVVNSFDRVRSQIQRKIYRTGKPAKPSYSSNVGTELNFDQD